MGASRFGLKGGNIRCWCRSSSSAGESADRASRENGEEMTRGLRSCVYCGVAFAGTGRALYCSQRCRNRVYVERHREERRAYLLQRRALHPRPPRLVLPPRACEQCGQPFTPFRADARYCSARCRYQAFLQRHHT